MVPDKLTLASPAKVNLFLRILGRRPDGYHSLASLFQAIDVADALTVSLDEADSLTCDVAEVPTDASNLILRAVDLFRRKTGLRFGVRVHLTKQIPVQAGLGGGSSNAATALWAVNELLGRPATLENLVLWACEIGSDVSFFLSEGTAYCTGRGEIVQQLEPLSPRRLWIAKPLEGLSTLDVYRRLNSSLLPPRDPRKALEAHLSGEPVYFNDLEHAAFTVMPKLALLKQQLLLCGFSQAMMSGSGSSFFCLGNGELPFLPGVEFFPARFINRVAGSWYQTSTPISKA